jgi:membrane protein YdbS with pleckstrin-like domain
MFENLEIALDELPDTDDLDWEQLHPLYARALRIVAAIALAIIALAITALTFIANIPLTPVVVLYSLLALAAAIALIWPGVSVPRQGYVLRDNDILFRKGVIWRSVTAIPFNRIQHVETSSTPIDRKLELATLQLFTAGGSGGDLKIGGLGKNAAEKLRVFILDKAGAAIEHT